MRATAGAGAVAALGWVLATRAGWIASGRFQAELGYCLVGIALGSVLWALRSAAAADARLRRGLAAAVWILAVGAFAHLHGDDLRDFLAGRDFRLWSVYHYHLGPKYFTELGYTGLYEQTLAADWEGPRRLEGIRSVRNLADYEVKRLQPGEFRRDRKFTDARWEAFKADVDFYTGYYPTPRIWSGILRDRGYNPTPFWNTVGWAFAWGIDIRSRIDRTVYCSIDLGLLLAAFGLAVWAFGALPAGMALLIFVLFPPNLNRLSGGFLTYDWFSAMLAGLAFWRRGRWRASALAWSYAVMTRVFPLLLVAGLVWPSARRWWSTREIESGPRRFALTFAIAGTAALVLGSLNAHGLKSWWMFKQDIAAHNRHMIYGEGRIGLPHLFTHRLGESQRFEKIPQRIRTLADQKTAYRLAAAAMMGLALWRLRRRESIDAALGTLPIFFALMAPSHYYWAILAFFPLMGPGRVGSPPHWSGLAVGLAPLAGWYLYAMDQSDMYARYLRMDVGLALGFVVWMIASTIGEWRIDRGILNAADDGVAWDEPKRTRSPAPEATCEFS